MLEELLAASREEDEKVEPMFFLRDEPYLEQAHAAYIKAGEGFCAEGDELNRRATEYRKNFWQGIYKFLEEKGVKEPGQKLRMRIRDGVLFKYVDQDDDDDCDC